MGQQDIISFLEKNKNKEFSRRELQEKLGVTNSHLSRVLLCLRKHNEINIRVEGNSYRSREYYSAKC